jgi:nitrogen fixation protein NifB
MNVIPITSASRFAAAATDAAVSTLRLPVAPQAVCRIRFSPETKMGQALSPAEVLLEAERYPRLHSVALEGPGDPLASIGATVETIAQLKKRYPELRIILTSLGFDGARYASDLATAGLDHLNLLVDTLDPATAQQLYAWIRPGKKTVPLKTVVPLLLEEQTKTVQAMVQAGVTVSIRTTVYPDINADQVGAIAETMAAQGATEIALLPFSPDPQQTDVPAAPTRMQMEQICKLAGQYMPATILEAAESGCSSATSCCGSGATVQAGLPQPTAARPRVAAVSATGMDVDLHLGQAKTILIYGPRADGLTCLLETRQAPASGSGENRWEQLAEILHDCFALLVASAGQRPREVLSSRGVRVIVTEENIEGTVDVLYGGGKKPKCGN